VSYGLSTVYSPFGISSLSSIISYGLSSIVAIDRPGVSSLSSIISYGLSSIVGIDRPGVSSLSSIISYGLSTVGYVTSNTFNREFLPSSIGATGINRNNQIDSVPDAISKIDYAFERLISKPPVPVLYERGTGIYSNIYTTNAFSVTFSNPPAFYFLGHIVPEILYAEISLSYSSGTTPPTTNPYSNINIFTVRTEHRINNPGISNYLSNDGTISIPTTTIIFNGNSNFGQNVFNTITQDNKFIYTYTLYNFSNYSFSNFNPYIFTFRWINNATYPVSNNYYSNYLIFGGYEDGIISYTSNIQMSI
jgi:hypothetical protein